MSTNSEIGRSDTHLSNLFEKLNNQFSYRNYFHISPPKTNFKGLAFIEPYSYGIWMSLFACIIVFSMLWPIIWKILLRDQNLNNDMHLKNDGLTFQLSLFIVLALFFQKASPYEPTSISMRILLGTIAYLSMVNFTAYSADLISAQMTAKVDFPFNSYHSFYYDTNYKFGQVSGTNFDELFQVNSPNLKIHS